jgi:hypothetical protein
MLFSYKNVYKVATWYIPYQLMYGLHPLMPTKYIMRVVGGSERDGFSVRVSTSRITKMEIVGYRKYMNSTMELSIMGSTKESRKNSSILVIMLCGFQKAINDI